MSTIEKLLGKVGEEILNDAANVETNSHSTTSSKSTFEQISDDPRNHTKNKKCIRLDYAGLESAGIFLPDRCSPQIRDEYRRIKRPLLDNAFGNSASLVDNGNIVVVTSSIPAEGKTFTAVNLALSITRERDHTVLLIDGDATKSDATRLFGLENEPGLVDLLVDRDLGIRDVIVNTDIENLSLIPSGTFNIHMAELFNSSRMRQVISEIGRRYDDRFVIIDSPPVLATSEGMILTALAGQIAFVVRAGNTPQRIVLDAIATLDRNKPIGLILNQTQKIFGSNVGGGYYGYGYGYGYGQK